MSHPRQHLLTNSLLTLTPIPFKVRRPPTPTPTLPAVLGRSCSRVLTTLERRMRAYKTSLPSSVFRKKSVSGRRTSWLPSLGLYLLADYPELTPPRPAGAKGLGANWASRRATPKPASYSPQLHNPHRAGLSPGLVFPSPSTSSLQTETGPGGLKPSVFPGPPACKLQPSSV